jgi:hypothetical protein
MVLPDPTLSGTGCMSSDRLRQSGCLFLSEDQVGTAMAGLEFGPMSLSYPSRASSS